MIIVYIIVAVIIAILLIAMTKPNHFRIERSIKIQAPAQNVFPLVNNFHQWKLWSPWENIDPFLQRQYKGAEAGVSAIYEWHGNKNVGKGRMEIIEAYDPIKILIRLDFLEPFVSSNTAEFIFTAQDGGTQVSWAMSGPNRFIGKLMSVFCNMDKMIGKNFEVGLANLKNYIEQPHK